MDTLLELRVEQFLSLQKLALDLKPLNVLVGPNGSGKTNILSVFRFLGEVARLDLIPAIDQMGGFEEILFRGEARKTNSIQLEVKGIISENASKRAPDEYRLRFWERNYPASRRRMVHRSEDIRLKRTAGRGRRIQLTGKSLKIAVQDNKRQPEELFVQGASTGLATLRKLGEDYSASGVEALARVFEQLRLFEIDVEKVRSPTFYRETTSLAQDAGNLASYLLYIKSEEPYIFERIVDDVRFVLPGFDGFEFVEQGGSSRSVTISIKEKHLHGLTPLARASYGTIRAIALFAMLNDPAPPKLTCLEEIDHGLHPHALDRIVDRLREASSRTQIILATHSPALVNRLNIDELIIVERDETNGSTRAFRPNRKLIRSLQDETGYELGELWFSGTLGGV